MSDERPMTGGELKAEVAALGEAGDFLDWRRELEPNLAHVRNHVLLGWLPDWPDGR